MDLNGIEPQYEYWLGLYCIALHAIALHCVKLLKPVRLVVSESILILISISISTLTFARLVSDSRAIEPQLELNRLPRGLEYTQAEP
jgi:hypothetical protein